MKSQCYEPICWTALMYSCGCTAPNLFRLLAAFKWFLWVTCINCLLLWAERSAISSAHHYATPYFFSAKALETDALEVVELEKVYRQKDEQFVRLLNKIRNNSVEPEDIKELNQRYQPDTDTAQDEAFTINLTTTNAKADEINETHLNGLDGKLHSHKAVIKGDFAKNIIRQQPHCSLNLDLRLCC